MPTDLDHSKIYDDKLLTRVSSMLHPDSFNCCDEDASKLGTISNPVRYCGAHFEKAWFDLALPHQNRPNF
ncbi:unnamed protein product [Cercopithifilaria johnstoni]|uniref:Uncharacterized protein n=1 Tax=Cercopithifilaria johnstoni TaxID=2874296 RepID=A0A8J2M023_9BILA|nr:unnamed protein product [Cercopithifilaria johnstoni]